MGRLIDEDMIIKVLERWQKAFKENSHYVSASDLSLVVKDVKELPTIQPEERTEKRTETHGVCLDAISRQAAIDAIAQCTNCGDEDTLREYVLKHSLDNGWTGGILEALDAVRDLPPAQPEPAIPLSWTDKYIEWLKSFDNEFANLEAAHISVMVKKWRDEQNE